VSNGGIEASNGGNGSPAAEVIEWLVNAEFK
jgi:hypothetical protein